MAAVIGVLKRGDFLRFNGKWLKVVRATSYPKDRSYKEIQFDKPIGKSADGRPTCRVLVKKDAECEIMDSKGRLVDIQ